MYLYVYLQMWGYILIFGVQTYNLVIVDWWQCKAGMYTSQLNYLLGFRIGELAYFGIKFGISMFPKLLKTLFFQYICYIPYPKGT